MATLPRLGVPLLCFTLHCTYNFSFSHKAHKVFVHRDQEKCGYQNWEQKYYQESNLCLNDLRMSYNTLDEGNNSCCLTMLSTFPEGFNKPLLALKSKLFQFSYQNWIWFHIYYCDFAELGLVLSYRQISNSNATGTKPMYAGREG